jgi:hypothetical protein
MPRTDPLALPLKADFVKSFFGRIMIPETEVLVIGTYVVSLRTRLHFRQRAILPCDMRSSRNILSSITAMNIAGDVITLTVSYD